MSQIIKVTDGSFAEDVLQAKLPVLLDFWAPWCGPCRAVAPILDEISTEYEDKVNIAKMDIDENPEVPAKYGIRSIPTLILYKDGEVLATKIGSVTKAQVVTFLDEHL